MYQREVRPLRTQFERQLQSCQDDVLRMGSLVEHSCWLAHQSLFSRNLSAVDALKLQDEQIDSYYRQIELDCIRLLALQSPVAGDLRLIGTLIQVVRDLERIGDYAEELGDVAYRLLPYPPLPCLRDLEHMSTVSRSMLATSLLALTNLDADSGRLLNIADDEVDASYDQVYSTLASQSNFQGSVEPLLLATLANRALERMADHATNISKRIAYAVTGQR